MTEEQWKLVEPVLRLASAGVRRGRPWHDTRAVLNGVLWVLGTGAQWRELPEKYPPNQTCHRRFQQWIRDGKLIEMLRLKEGFAIGPTRRGKGTKIIAIAADNSLPLAVTVESALPAECQLVEEALAASFLDELRARLIGDKAYDSDGLGRNWPTTTASK